jgi:3-hydroxy-9,10-secoandrosta-1,3,5(10)-triene-9,17-dione monooxygenase reductase component
MAEPPGVAALPRIDAQSYREVLGRFASGVTVVTALDDTGGKVQPWGTTVNSFTGVSLDPPLVLVCIGRGRSIHPLIERTGRFGVNILGEDSQQLSDCFAGAPSALPRSAFCNAGYTLSAAGLPLIEAAIAFVACEVEQVIPGGDHTIYLARVVETETCEDPGWPLLYFRRRYLRIERAATADLLGKADR